MQEFSTLVQFGGIGLGAMSMWMFYKIASNHIDHNTQALQKLTDLIEQLKDIIQAQR